MPLPGIPGQPGKLKIHVFLNFPVNKTLNRKTFDNIKISYGYGASIDMYMSLPGTQRSPGKPGKLL
jgi:hypothetical protein